MKIVQLSDLHIGSEGEQTLDIDVRGNLLKVLPKVEFLQPDLLVLSGDLCYNEAEKEIYDWIRPRIEALNIPYEVISGNHDDPEMLAECMGKVERLQDKELFFRLDINGYKLLFLDSTTGFVSKNQQDWLEEELKQFSSEAFVFMHHPPLFGGVPHMDSKYSLKNKDRVQHILNHFPGHVHVFCGHYHVDKVLHKRNVTAYITPSTFFQIDQHFEEFRVEHYRPGLREITVDIHGLRTNTIYPE